MFHFFFLQSLKYPQLEKADSKQIMATIQMQILRHHMCVCECVSVCGGGLGGEERQLVLCYIFRGTFVIAL